MSEGVELGFDSGAGAATESCGNVESRCGDNLNVTMSDFDFVVIFAVESVGDVMSR